MPCYASVEPRREGGVVMLREQVIAIRAGAAAQVAMADAILAALDGAASPPAAPPGGVCAHPAETRMAVPRMGAPEAWRCACGAEGEG